MAALADRAVTLVQQYQPARTEIWLGILSANRHRWRARRQSVQGSGFAKQARDILEKVVKVDPFALDAGARRAWAFYLIAFPAGRSASAISQSEAIA